jgi:hypothetical protein
LLREVVLALALNAKPVVASDLPKNVDARLGLSLARILLHARVLNDVAPQFEAERLKRLPVDRRRELHARHEPFYLLSATQSAEGRSAGV